MEHPNYRLAQDILNDPDASSLMVALAYDAVSNSDPAYSIEAFGALEGLLAPIGANVGKIALTPHETILGINAPDRCPIFRYSRH